MTVSHVDPDDRQEEWFCGHVYWRSVLSSARLIIELAQSVSPVVEPRER